MLEISTNNLKKWREVKIDGHIFKVREVGAGDQLDMSRFGAEVIRHGKKATNLKSKMKALEKLDADKEADSAKITKIMDDMNNTMDNLNKAQDQLNSVYLKMFDDGTNDQHLTQQLLDKVGTDGLVAIINQVFNQEITNDGEQN